MGHGTKLNKMYKRKFKEKITCDELKKRFFYDPATGIFTRLGGKSKYANRNSGIRMKSGYIGISADHINYAAHRLAFLYMTGEWPKNYVDHKDMDRANNKWENLRDCTQSQNLRNTGVKKNNKLGVKGISKNRQGYAVRINIGTYKTIEEAIEVYNKAIIIFHGEFARLSYVK